MTSKFDDNEIRVGDLTSIKLKKLVFAVFNLFLQIIKLTSTNGSLPSTLVANA